MARELDLAYALMPPTHYQLSIAPDRTWLGLWFLVAFSLLLIGTARALSRVQSRRLAGGIAALGTVMAIVGLAQEAMWNGKIYGFWEPIGIGDPFGPFVNRNHFAGWMLMALPLSIGLLCSSVAKSMRGIGPGVRSRILWVSSTEASHVILTAFGALTMALALVMTMSRSGMMVLAVTLAIAAGFTASRLRGNARRAVIGAYLLFVITVVAWVGPQVIIARFADPNTLGASGRFAIWSDTIRIANDFWLTGTGLNTYGIATLFHQTAFPSEHLREAHSDYLQLLAEGGLLLTLPVIVTVTLFGRAVRRRFRDDVGSISWLRAGAVAGLVAIALQSLGEFSLQMPGNAVLFTVLAAIALHDSRVDEGRHGRRSTDSSRDTSGINSA